MHWTALLAKRFFPPEARVIDDVACIQCGYNLRGARAAGHCPECNAQVGDSLFILARPAAVADGVRSLGQGFFAFLALGLGCIQGTALWAQMVTVGILLCGAIWQVFALVRLRWHSAIDNLPVIAWRIRITFVVGIVNLAVLALWLAA